MSDLIDRIAALVATARGCDDTDSCKGESGELPCSFCHWTEEAKEESGCYYWAGRIVEEVNKETNKRLATGLSDGMCTPNFARSFYDLPPIVNGATFFVSNYKVRVK